MIAALGRHLLESTTWALLLVFLVFCLRNRRAAARHAMWFLAAAKFAVPVALLAALGALAHNLSPFSQLPSVLPQQFSLLPSPREALPQQASAPHIWLPILLAAIWLIGALAMLVSWRRRVVEVRGVVSSVRDIERQAFGRMKQRLKLRGDIRLRASKSNLAPFLSGFWRPTITIPEGLSAHMSPDELGAVILHELAHVSRWDNWSSAFVHFLVCVFWFHPLLWWIERRLISERELACDELVLSTGTDPENYAAGILKVCRWQLADVVPGILGITNSNLKKRMEVIMSFSGGNKTNNRAIKMFLGALAATMIVIPLTLGLLAANNLYGQSGEAAKVSSSQEKADKQISCIFGDVNYPEGTVIRTGRGPEQMCVRHVDKNNELAPLWVHTTKETRERAQTVVSLPEPPPFVCTPEPSRRAGFCSCETDKSFSQNAIVRSANGGRLRCDKGKWVVATAEWTGEGRSH
jgi:beta-lactamase regulating signal transducer with metallopeptidase domain